MVLKALVETNDREIFEGLVGAAGSAGLEEKQFVTDRVELLLRTYKVYGLHSKAKTRAYLGEKFKVVMQLPADVTDEEAGTEFLRKIVLPHLGCVNVTPAEDADKFRMLLFMTRKLYALVEGDCAVDNPDAVQNQEILLGGQLYGMLLKERLEEWLNSFQLVLREWGRKTEYRPFTSQEFHEDIATDTNEHWTGYGILPQHGQPHFAGSTSPFKLHVRHQLTGKRRPDSICNRLPDTWW